LASQTHPNIPQKPEHLYLLGLAARHHGRLVTFDEKIPLSAVSQARGENLCLA
jgi:hypothetical protein